MCCTEISFYVVAYFMCLVDCNVDMIQYIVLFFPYFSGCGIILLLTWRMTCRNAAGIYAVFGPDVRFYLQVVERAFEDCGFSWRSL
jgi:hypothetical protein